MFSRRKRTQSITFILLFGFCFTLSVQTLHAGDRSIITMRTQDEKELIIKRISLIAGAAIGLGLGIFTVCTQDLYVENAPSWKIAVTAVPSMIIMTGSSALACWGFAETFMALKVNKWLSFPSGILFGGIASGLAGAMGFGSIFLFGTPLGIMATGEATTLTNYGLGLLAGLVWGGLFGTIPGVVFGPAISFYMDY